MMCNPDHEDFIKLKEENKRLRDACIESEYENKTMLKKAMGADESGMMAIELIELLVLQDKFRVQKKHECFTCDGTGNIIVDNPEIEYPTTGTCPHCKGDGYTWETVEVK